MAIMAQENKLESRKNEVRFDVFSVVVNANFSNSSKTKEDFNDNNRNNLPKYEINPYVRYALSKSKKRYYFAEVFASANGGDFKEIVKLTDGSGNDYYTTQVSKYTDIGLGGALGYKMYIK